MIVINNDIYFIDKEEANTFLYSKKIIGNESEGTVIKYKNRSLKFFVSYDLLFSESINKEDICRFRNISIRNVCFTDGIIYSNDDIIGSSAIYAPGLSLIKFDMNSINILNLVESIKKLNDTIYLLSKKKIFCYDIHAGNIIFDGVTFRLIDTSCYEYLNLDFGHIYNLNYKVINKTILNCILYNGSNNLNDFFSFYFGYSPQELFNDGLDLPTLLFKMKKDLDIFYDCYVYSFNDIIILEKQRQRSK